MTYIDSTRSRSSGAGRTGARRFVEFVLTDEGQALWQFPSRRRAGESPDGLGPVEHELRRMPARPDFYETYRERFVDSQLSPFTVVTKTPVKGWRSMIAPLLATSSIDIHREQRAAWDAIARVRAAGLPESVVAAIEDEFFAMPMHELPDGLRVLLTEENFRRVREDWRDPARASEHSIAYTAFFRAQYRKVRDMADEAMRRGG